MKSIDSKAVLALLIEEAILAGKGGYRRVGIGEGMTADYKNVSVRCNESVTADDDLVIYLTKTIGD